ncbi:MAG TPA: threonine--tRNA ligase, partial [Gaiellaceae bacterium]
MRVRLPDESTLELPDGASGLDAARTIGPKLAEQAVGVRVDGELRDLRLPLADGQKIEILTTKNGDDPDALAVLRHSAAHLLAEAVRRLYPGVKVAIGPAIENGFYYDFDFPEPIAEENLTGIEEEMRREVSEGRSWERVEISREDAKKRFLAEDEPYKVELLEEAEGAISLYGEGDFTDLCRGAHLIDSKPIKALKLTGLAGAYWRGDSANKQLTRIYGTAFFSKKDLDTYLERLEEAKRRDHRRLGVQLDLFHFDEHSPGSPFWHPRGMTIFNQLEALRLRENARRGYSEVKTPLIYDKALWVTSGHWEKFRENMFLIPLGDDHVYGIKPMNCPGHMLLYGSKLRSYRDLPIRYAEGAPLHRNELAGVLHGLTRVRYVTQDDAHIFCSEEQIASELDGCFEYLRYIYGLFEIEPRAELSTRPENKLGSDEEWDFTEGELRSALDRHSISYALGAGEGSFYGPKIDLHITDVLGRSWQMGTIQLDAQMPARFGLTYVGADNSEHPVFV